MVSEGERPVGRAIRATLLIAAVLLVGLSGYDLSRSLATDSGSPACSSAWSAEAWPLYWVFGADSITPATAYEDWVVNRYPPRATYYSAHTFWFPDFLLYFACRALTGATAPAVVLCGAAQFALLVAAFWLLGEAVFGARARWARTVVLLALASAYLLVVSLTLTTGWLGDGYALMQLLMMLHVLMMQQHAGAVIVTIAVLALLLFALRDWARPWRRALWLLGVFTLTAAGVASDRLLSLWLIAPAGVVLGLAWLYGRREGTAALVSRGAALGAGAVLAAAWVAGSALLQWQAGSRVIRLNNFLQPSGMRASWKMLLKTPENFRHGDVLHWALAAWLALCLAAAVAFLRRRAAAEERRMPRTLVFVVWFYLILSAGNVAVVILTGQLASPYGSFRYLLPVFVVPALGWALWLPVVCRSGRAQAGAAAALLAAGVLLLAVAWRQPRSGEFLAWDYYPPEVQRLDELAEKYGLTNGIAAYFQAKPYSLLSRRGLQLVQVCHSKVFPGWEPFLQLNSKDSYLDGDGPAAHGRAYNFLILDSHPLPPAEAPAIPPLEQVVAMFGEPAALVPLNSWERVAIYNRPTDTAFRDWALHCRSLVPEAAPSPPSPSQKRITKTRKDENTKKTREG